jgi:flagellar basal body-associated protein FliL
MNAENQDQEKQSNSLLFILLGAILGALTGAGAGYLLTKRLEEGDEIQLTAGDGIKLGGSIIAFLRQVASLGN